MKEISVLEARLFSGNLDRTRSSLTTCQYCREAPVEGLVNHGGVKLSPLCWRGYMKAYASASMMFPGSNLKDMVRHAFWLQHSSERTFGKPLFCLHLFVLLNYFEGRSNMNAVKKMAVAAAQKIAKRVPETAQKQPGDGSLHSIQFPGDHHARALNLLKWAEGVVESWKDLHWVVLSVSGEVLPVSALASGAPERPRVPENSGQDSSGFEDNTYWDPVH